MSKLRALTAVTAAALLSLGVAVAADVKDLSNKLKKAVGANSTEHVQEALTGLIEAGGAQAAEEVLGIIPKLNAASDTSYWQLVNAAGGFRDAQALAAVGEFIVKKKKAPFARDVLFALENNPSPHVTAALGPVLEKGTYDMQLMAADQLGMVATTAGVDALIAALKREGDDGDPTLRRRLMASLSTVTKQNMGDALNWIGWWEANRGKGLPEPEEGPSEGQFASSTMNDDRRAELESVKRHPERIIVISSKLPKDHPKQPGHDYNYDHMEQILSGMEIPHKVVLKADFEKNPRKYLEKAWTVLINCNNIQTQCVCKACLEDLNKRAQQGNLGPKNNRLFGCPPDCPQGHDQVCFAMDDRAIQALRSWVEDEGGYLFTEDWGVVEVIDRAWPKLVSSHKYKENPPGGGDPVEKIELVKATTVPIVPGRGMTSLPLLRGVFTRPRPPAREPEGGDEGGSQIRDLGPKENPASPVKHQWVIDDESPSIHVVDPRNVTVLMESDALGQYAKGDTAVAVTFRVGSGKTKKPAEDAGERRGPVTGAGGALEGKSRGKGEWAEELRGGRVLHCISHFGKQQGSKSDTFVLQNLILNFIMESNRQHGG